MSRRGPLKVPAREGAALLAVLELLPGAALVAESSGRIHRENAAARRWRERAPREFARSVQEGLCGRGGGGLRALPIETDPKSEPVLPGEWFLLVEKQPSKGSSAAVTGAAAEWRLTPRQTEVLALLVRGLSNREISARLGCAPGTLESHVSAVLRRSSCRNRTELVARLGPK